MPPKNHGCKRTVEQWVVWANGEGFIDIVEHAPNADTVPGVHGCVVLQCPMWPILRKGILFIVRNVDCCKLQCIEAALHWVLVWQRRPKEVP